MRLRTWHKGCVLGIALVVIGATAVWGISALRQAVTPVRIGTYVPHALPALAVTPLNPRNANRIGPAGTLGGGKVYDVAYIPNGRFFAAATSSGIGLYDSETLTSRWFVETTAQVSKIVATPDSELLITANPVRFWEAASGKLLREVQEITAVGMAVSADSQLFAASVGSEIHVWRLGSFEEVQVLRGQRGEATGMSFSPDGKILVAGSFGTYKDQQVYVWRVSSGELLQQLPGHTDIVTDVEFSPDGRSFATASFDNTVRVWQVGDCNFPNDACARLSRKLWAFLSNQILCIAYSPDGKTLAAGSEDGNIRLWNLSLGWATTTLRGDHSKITGLDFSPDGEKLIASSRSHWLYGGIGKIQVWQTDGALRVGTVNTEGDVIGGVAFSPDGVLLASTGQWDSTIRIWRVADGVLLRVMRAGNEQDGVLAGNFSPDGLLFASVSPGAIQLWRVADGAMLDTQDKLGPVHHVAFSPIASPEGHLLAAGTSDKITLWIVGNERLETWRTLEGQHGFVKNVAFSSDGSLLASVATDSSLQIWRVADGSLLQTIPIDSDRDIKALAFSREDSRLAVGVGSEIWVWEWQTGKLVWQMKGHTATIYEIACNSEGTLLASAAWDNNVRLWDAAEGTLLNALTGHSDYVNSVAFSPDGLRLASGGYDGVVRLWGIPEPAGALAGR